MDQLPDSVVRALRKERDDLMRQRAAAVAKFDQEINELDQHLAMAAFRQSGTPITATAGALSQAFDSVTESALSAASSRILNQRAVDHCKLMLQGGKQLKAGELHAGVVSAGIFLKAANAEHRLVQLLSENKEIFQSDRKNGWSLKGESPAGTGLSFATESAEDFN